MNKKCLTAFLGISLLSFGLHAEKGIFEPESTATLPQTEGGMTQDSQQGTDAQPKSKNSPAPAAPKANGKKTPSKSVPTTPQAEKGIFAPSGDE